MARYIDVEEAMYYFREIMPDPGENEVADEMYGILLNMRELDVVPAKYGHWLLHEPKGRISSFDCSECYANSPRMHNFCYNCGANMEVKYGQ